MTTPNTPNESLRDELIEAYYIRRINNHPAIHTNRFPAWSELTDDIQADLTRDFDNLVHVLTAHGLKIVPVEPTDEMAFAGANRVRTFNQWEKPGMASFDREMERFSADKTVVRAANICRAMLAAAPNYLEDKSND